VLRTRGWKVSRGRVERLMRREGIRARMARLYRPNPRLHRFYEQHPNRLWKRQARKPDRVWVSDITYVSVAGQWRYLAVVIDQCSRRVLGWSLARIRGARLTRTAFDLAARRRRPKAGLIFHSDRGSEYAGNVLGDRLKTLGIRQSMTRGGCPSDNAHAESFFHSLKADVIHGRRFHDEEELRRCLRAYIAFYNRGRLHSALGYRSPIEYEHGVA
jgi:putative transposase